MRLAFDRSIAVRLWRAATLLLAGVLCSSAASAQTAVTFTSNGTYTVPPVGVRLLRIQVNGGGGGGGACGAGGAGGSGGNGGSVSGSVAVTPGQTFFVQVGQGGAPGVARGALGVVGAGGMGGMSPLAGGQGGSGFLLGGGGGGGGGATVVSTMMGTSTVILVAGGGGGGTGGGGAVGPAGGAGGMLNGGPGAATGGMSPLSIDGGGGGGGGGGTPGGAGGSANTGGAGASASVGGSSLIHTGFVTMGAAMVGSGGSGGAGLRAGCTNLMLGQPGSPGSVTITEFECSGPDQCLDTNPCTQDACVGNTCFHRPLNTDEMCIGAAGFCLNNGLTSQCVGCTSNSQCSGSAPACDTTTHNCRPCAVATQGTDCQTGQLCNGASGSCGGCSVAVQTPMNMGTASGTPIFSGRSTPGQTVTVTVDGMAVGFAVVDASGNWSLPWPTGGTPLSNGTHSYSAVGCGGTSTSAGVFTVNSGCGSNAECPASTPICDLTRRACRPCNPATQATDCGSLVCNTSTGACASLAVAIVSPPSGSNTTNRPTITGTATPGQMVTVTVDGMVVGTVTADASGMWFLPWPSTTPSLGLGTHHLAANAGNTPGPTASATGTFFVPCASNNECSGGTPICDRSTGSCRACTPSGMSSAECDSRTPFCSSTGSTAGQCVLLPPSIVMPAAGSSTSSGRPPITGTGPANSMIVVLLDGMRAGTVTTDAAGNWVFVPPTALAPGMHRVSAANVSAGVTGPEGTPHGFTITPCALSTDCAGLTPVCDATSRTCRACAVDADCASPRPRCANTGALAGMCVAAVPTVTTPADGTSTGSRRPTIRGVAPPGSIVSVLLDGVDVGRATADANGDFTFTPTMDLSLGMHTVAGHVAQDGGTFGPTGNMVRFTVTSCATRAECSGGTPVCDSTSHNCRACNPATEATDCPDPQRPVCATTGTQQGQCVVQRPLVTTPAEGSRSTNTHPTFSGTGTPGSTVVVLVDGAEVGRTMVDASGRWTLTPGGSTSAGAHTVAASNVAPDGAQGLPGNMVHFTVLECDANAPCAAGLRCDELAGRCVPVGQDAGPGDGSEDASGTDAGEDAALEATAGDGSALDASAPTGGGRSFASGACACEAPGRVGGTSRAGLALALCALGLAAARRRRVL